MSKWQVRFIAGYEVTAKDEAEAKEKGWKELEKELNDVGTKNLIVEAEKVGA